MQDLYTVVLSNCVCMQHAVKLFSDLHFHLHYSSKQQTEPSYLRVNKT